MKRYSLTIRNTAFANFNIFDCIIWVPLILLEEGFDWLTDKTEHYHVFGHGTCKHGYFIEREAWKYPFAKRHVRERIVFGTLSPDSDHTVDEVLTCSR